MLLCAGAEIVVCIVVALTVPALRPWGVALASLTALLVPLWLVTVRRALRSPLGLDQLLPPVDHYRTILATPPLIVWSVDATGIITFQPGHIPAIGQTITAGFEFDVPVRFDTDKLEISIQGFRHGAIPSIPIVEIRL